MTVYGWDCSDFDWSRGGMSLTAAAADGIVMVTHKATEGTNVKHVHLADALNRGRAAGIPILGAYHVVRSSPSVAAQVSYYFSYLDQQVPWWRNWPGFVLQVDLEKWPYDPVTVPEAPHRYLTEARPAMAGPERLYAAGTGASFAAELRARKPASASVIVYASKGQYGDSLAGIGSPLWNANYPSTRSAPYRGLYPGDKGAGWATYSGQMPVLWQYASTATIGSQPGCDINAFRGTLADLQALLGINGTAPGGGLMASASDIITAWAGGVSRTADGTIISPVVWRIRDEAWQVKVDAAVTQNAIALAAFTAAITALADVIKKGGGSVDSAAIIAAVESAATAAVDEAVAAVTVQLAAAEARESELKAALAAALKT
jgi:GH25 family lysozyme M1 (1,4-beta-N-acetylmuramidase)